MDAQSTEHRAVVIVMGVSGSGKSTVGRMVTDALAWSFLDADDFHSQAAKTKMSQSIPLSAEDRKPWIDAVVARLNATPDAPIVLACSALTHAIRQRFRTETRAHVLFVYLKVAPAQLAARLAEREGHYAKAGLLQSQLDTLQEPTRAIIVNVAEHDSPAQVCARVQEHLARA